MKKKLPNQVQKDRKSKMAANEESRARQNLDGRINWKRSSLRGKMAKTAENRGK